MKFLNASWVAAVLLSSLAVAVFPQHAYKRFKDLTGIKVKPKSSFTLCQTIGEEPMGCKPTGGEDWYKDRIQELPLSIVKNQAEVDKEIQKQIARRYLGAGLSGGNLLNFSCRTVDDTQPFYKDTLHLSAVRNSAIAELVKQTIIKDASVAFEVALKAINVANKAGVKSAFETKLSQNITGEAKNSVDVKWLVVSMNADWQIIQNTPSLAQCVNYIGTSGSIVTGVAGFVVMSSAGSSDYVTSRSFEIAANAALTGDPNGQGVLVPQTQLEISNAAAGWVSKTTKEFDQKIISQIEQPTFYPIWTKHVWIKRNE